MNYLNSLEPIKLFERDSRSELYVDKSMLIEAVSEKMELSGQYYPAEAVW